MLSDTIEKTLAKDSYYTSVYPERQRPDFWSSLVRDLHHRVDFVPLVDSTYTGELKRFRIDGFQLVDYICEPSIYVRHESHIRADGGHDFEFLVPLNGPKLFEHMGRVGICRPGQFLLIDPTEPYNLRQDSTLSAILFRTPRRLLEQRLPDARGACGRVHDGSIGLAKIALDVNRSIAAQAPQLLGHQFVQACHTLIDLLALSIEGSSDLQSVGSQTRACVLRRIKRYIDDNLGHPDLSTPALARQMGISERYVQSLFKEAGTTARDYVRETRLNMCDRRLRSESAGHKTITQISFDCGFSDSAYFSTAFRSKFGVSPKQVKHPRKNQ